MTTGVFSKPLILPELIKFLDRQLEDETNRFGAYSKITLSWEEIKVSVTVDSGRGPPCLRSNKDTKTKKDILKGGKLS